MSGKPPPSTLRQLWRHIMAAEDAGRVATTCELAKRYVARAPGHGSGWLALAMSLRQVARYREAHAAIRRGLTCAREPYHFLAYKELGQLHEARGEYEKARDAYRRAIRVAPSRMKAGCWIFLGGLLAREGRFTRALVCHRTAIRLAGKKDDIRAEGYLNVGYILRAQGRYVGAERAFGRALRIDPRYKEARIALADVRAARLEGRKSRSPRS